MRLKDIKPGMVVHCKTKEEIEELAKHKHLLSSVEDIWNCSHDAIKTDCISFDDKGKFYGYATYAFFKNNGRKITEFSDLILPELTAEEVVPILMEICAGYVENHDCEGCPLSELEHIINGNECPFTFKDYRQVVEICAQWKADHEKKAPEIEWVYRVFGAENYGEKFFQTEEEAIKRCEELAKSQKTKQYARYERVCRVKAVE